MATSGDISLTVTRDEIITDALESLGVIEAGKAPNANDITTCARTLNFMIKAWQTDGLQVFTVKRGYLFLERNKHDYELSDSGDNWTYDYTADATTADAAAAQAVITVADDTDYTNNDFLGMALDDGTVQWTTLSSKSGAGALTLADNLTAASSSGSTVMYYTSKADEPMGVVEASLRNESLNDRPITMMARQEWSELSNKTYDGSVTQLYFDERIDPPHLFTWPESAQNFDVLVLWIKRIFFTFVDATDNPDFPQEFYLPLSTNLAVAVGPKFGTPSTNKNFKELKEQAIFWYEKAQNYDSGPEANVRFAVDMGP